MAGIFQEAMSSFNEVISALSKGAGLSNDGVAKVGFLFILSLRRMH